MNNPQPPSLLVVELYPSGSKFIHRAGAKLGLPIYLESIFPAKQDAPTLPDKMGLEALTSLAARIQSYKPTAIVCLGETAFQWLCSKFDTRVYDAHCYVFDYKGIPVIPTFAPAQLFSQPDYFHWFGHAFAKAGYLAKEPKTSPSELLRLSPSLADVQTFCARAREAAQLSIDIECIKETLELTAIAIALPGGESMSIPLAKQHLVPYFEHPNEELEAWLAIRSVLAAPNRKIFQNAMFDVMILEHFGLPTNGQIEDTLWIANLLNPELPKGLKDLGRQYLYCEPWKTQKDFTLSGDPVAFWKYNALDASRTFAIYEKQKAELAQRGMKEFYDLYIEPLLNPALQACQKGFRVNHSAYAEMQEAIRNLTGPLSERLISYATPICEPFAKRIRKRNKSKDIRGASPRTGKEIVLEKGYDETVEPFNPASPDQVKKVLKALGYKIPTKDGKETTDQIALLKLARKMPSPFIDNLLLFKKLEKIQTSYLAIAFDADGRCRFTFNRARDQENNLGTKSGRFGCSTTPWGTGLNVQTIPRKDPNVPVRIKDIFIPEDGSTFVEVDLSQAELRVVAWLSGDEKLISQLEAGDDIHQYMADEIQRVLHIDASRQFGKFVNHSTAYGLGKFKFTDKLLKDLNVSISPDLAQSIIDLRMTTYPRLREWQNAVANEVRFKQKLISPHGRERYFFGLFDDSVHREALSFIPQATVVDTINRAWIELAALPEYNKEFRVVCQVHDSLLFDVKDAFLSEFLLKIHVLFLKLSFKINGINRVIKHDVKTGKSWGSMKAA